MIRRLRNAPDCLLVLAAAVVLRLMFAALVRDTYDYDEFVILLLARDFAHGLTPYESFMFFHPPGILYIFRALTPLTDLWWPAGRVIVLMVDSATAILVWTLARTMFDRRAALFAGLSYAVCPLTLIAAVRVGQDPLVGFFGTLGLVFLVRRPSSWRAVTAGVCLAIGVWIKFPAALFVPVYLLAAPRRFHYVVLGGGLAIALLLAPFLPVWHSLYDQTVGFQRTRWSMALDTRLETAGLFWVVVNPFALAGLWRARRVPWLLAGYLAPVVFLFSSQVYYHYFVPFVPFAAILSGPVLVTALRASAARLLAVGTAVAVLAAVLIDEGGPAPLFVTAAHLSAIHKTIVAIDRETGATDRILADRYEYPYLANRTPLAHYFWNIGIIVNASFLERRVPRSRLVVLSEGASSGYPPGFVQYLDGRYPRTKTGTTTIWTVDGRSAGGEIAAGG